MNTPEYILRADGHKQSLTMCKTEQRYALIDGKYQRTKNKLPRDVMRRSIYVTEDSPGVATITYVEVRSNLGTKSLMTSEYIIPMEVWGCCLMKWNGAHVGPLISYVYDYMKFPGRMEAEMFEYSYDDWAHKYECDPESRDKCKAGKERYLRSLGTFDKFASLYYPTTKATLTFDADNPLECYIAYHRATPTYIASILGIMPMWMQMEQAKKRWCRWRQPKQEEPRGTSRV